MSLLALPNELILLIAYCLEPDCLNALLRANRRFAVLLTPLLNTFAIQPHRGTPALHWAASNRHAPLIKLLLGIGLLPDTRHHHDFTPLHIAAGNGDVDIISPLLIAGANPNLATTRAKTPLLIAITGGHIAAVSLLLSHPALASKSANSPAVLEAAVRSGHTAIARLLIENGCDVNARGCWGGAPLHWAILAGHTAIVRLLLDSGADVNPRIRETTALHWAIQHSREEIAELLISRGADPNARNAAGDTPLHIAARWKYSPGVSLLLNTADLTLTNMKHQTPLQIASWCETPEIVHQIFTKAISLNLTSSITHKIPPLHIAAQNGLLDITQTLLSQGVNVNAQCAAGNTALILAASHGHERVIELLLRYGVDIALTNKVGRTAFYKAVENRQEGAVRLLAQFADLEGDVYSGRVLEYLIMGGGVKTMPILRLVVDRVPAHKIDFRNESGETLLHLVCTNHHAPRTLIEYLLSRGADVDVEENSGQTPLHRAVVHGNVEAVMALLEGGADWGVRDEKGETALMVGDRAGGGLGKGWRGWKGDYKVSGIS